MSLDDVSRSMQAAGVARFKIPERRVVVDEMPTTKIDKKTMRDDIRMRLDRDKA
ncbi:hypothetical protein ACWDPV_09545 [Gordonia sp. NPDC003504]